MGGGGVLDRWRGMRMRYLILAALMATTMAVSGCAEKGAGPLVVGKTYTAALSMAMLNFKVLSYQGKGWYSVQLIGQHMSPFSTAVPALINARKLSLLQSQSGN